MQTIVSQLDAGFRRAILKAFDVDVDPAIARSQNEKFGDYQSNAAMSLAKTVGEKNPRAVAEKIKSALELGAMVDEVSIAGPGFINVKLSLAWLSEQLKLTAADKRLGVPVVANPQTVVIDYSHPNIAKEMHVGHLRSTIIGDSIARVLHFRGDRVIRQNHIGDWGTQFGRVILAIWHICMAKDRNEPNYPIEKLKALQTTSPEARRKVIEEVAAQHQKDYDRDKDGREIFAPFLERYHPDLDALLPVYQFVTAVEDAPEAEQVTIAGRSGAHKLSELSKLITSYIQKGVVEDALNRQEIRAWSVVRAASLDACQRIYDRLGVWLTQVDEYGESRYNPMLPGVVAELMQRGFAVESQGAIAVFVDGPDKPPMVIRKSGDEGYLYATTDLAAVRYRVDSLRANRVIYVVDARQQQHLRQVFETATRAGWVPAGVQLQHASFGTMLGEDGRPFKTRRGDVLKLEDLIDESEERALAIVTSKNTELNDLQKKAIARAIGIGAVKYADLSKDRVSDYVFNWNAMLSMDGNTAPYLQYAHARIRSIQRKAETPVSQATISLNSPHEASLAKHVLRFGEIVEDVARDLKPHVMCTYLYELASIFSGFYENCPVIQSEEPTRSSRLALCELTANVLAKGLDLLGIEHPEQM